MLLFSDKNHQAQRIYVQHVMCVWFEKEDQIHYNQTRYECVLCVYICDMAIKWTRRPTEVCVRLRN